MRDKEAFLVGSVFDRSSSSVVLCFLRKYHLRRWVVMCVSLRLLGSSCWVSLHGVGFDLISMFNSILLRTLFVSNLLPS